MATRDETETSVVYDLTARVYRVWTNYGPHRRKFLAMVEEGRAELVVDDGEVLSILVPDSEYDLRRGFKTKRAPMSDEQRAAAAKRLAEGRLKRGVA